MKHLAALAPFVSVAAAIDAFLYTTPDCKGPSGIGGGFGSYLRCLNLRANTCCGINTTDSPFQSIGIQDIRDGFAVNVTGYGGGNCTERVAGQFGGVHSRICIPDFGVRYTGCNWNSGFSKRESSKGKLGCQRPDVLVLPDGTEYELSRLSDDSFQEM
ncbi:hypothetical protein FVEN_g4415 [Fusarium venenatum]|nr:hypothetical protein FVEN_g4415 [Fusarium venenatum]